MPSPFTNFSGSKYSRSRNRRQHVLKVNLSRTGSRCAPKSVKSPSMRVQDSHGRVDLLPAQRGCKAALTCRHCQNDCGNSPCSEPRRDTIPRHPLRINSISMCCQHLRSPCHQASIGGEINGLILLHTAKSTSSIGTVARLRNMLGIAHDMVFRLIVGLEGLAQPSRCYTFDPTWVTERTLWCTNQQLGSSCAIDNSRLVLPCGQDR